MSEISTPRRKRITAPDLISLKAANKRIVAVTVYDYPSALIVESAEIDIALVGDSVAMVLGYQNTLPVTIEEMLHHLKAVRRGLRTPLLVVDMPFGSYQCGTDQAVASAVRLIKEGGAQVVKLEGGKPVLEIVRKLTSHGIPVMGHLGLTPQSVNQFGGHKVQGKEVGDANQMLMDSKALQEAGVIALVLETIPADLAAEISKSLRIPTIGIGAGVGCDGEVQVWYDLLGLMPGKPYKHAGQFAELRSPALVALREYARRVREGSFPTEEHSI